MLQFGLVRFCVSVYCLFLMSSSVEGLSEEMQELVNMLHTNCIEETGVAEGTIEDARNLNFAEDEKLKCYMRCLMIQMATMDDDGIIDVDATIALLPDEMKTVFSGPLKTCGTKVGANHCDNAFQTNKCWADILKTDYYLI
uniref:Odorant-binding protein 10 n=1 Tax=Chrysopa pallens TaxID=417485 RepID=A0A0G3ZCM9_CHRPA|nr:odorant-binding protein 10 [Chrysopa pallens]AKW47200.1 odorant binding protein 10 [Chrysopa pallens]